MRAFLLLLAGGVAFADEGTVVSRPLTPVEEPAKVDPPPTSETVADVDVNVKVGGDRSWSSFDLLLWWSKRQPLPALVTGGASSRTLVGSDTLGNGLTSGFRFNMGWGDDCDSLLGFEFGGLFLGTNVTDARYDSLVTPNLARPFIDARTGIATSLPVGVGSIDVATTTRVQGWEVNLVKNLVDAGEARVMGIVGYRYLGVNEGLHVAQTTLRPNVLFGSYDQFDARNNFQGGQIGLKIDGTGERWFLSLSGKVGFGNNYETVIVRGGSSATTAALPALNVQRFNEGFLAVGSNSGRSLQSHFAVLPEAQFKLGYRIGGNCFVSVGYDFLYLSDAVRPGDQVDLTIDPSRSPIANTGGPLGPNRPTQPFVRSDFWTQGITLGLDCRY